MHYLKGLGIFLGMTILAAMAMAATNSMGIHDISRVTFVAPMHVGAVVLPAGDYVVRHTMQGPEHIMVFERAGSKDQFKVKCTLMPLSQKAERDQTIYVLNAQDERELQELIFKGDSAKHVF